LDIATRLGEVDPVSTATDTGCLRYDNRWILGSRCERLPLMSTNGVVVHGGRQTGRNPPRAGRTTANSPFSLIAPLFVYFLLHYGPKLCSIRSTPIAKRVDEPETTLKCFENTRCELPAKKRQVEHHAIRVIQLALETIVSRHRLFLVVWGKWDIGRSQKRWHVGAAPHPSRKLPVCTRIVASWKEGKNLKNS